ncbi:unnamed protein product [Ceutorhynchus assimilis]|uniref:Regulatory protein zeste n=1 Tax=Ceutorhynchus assimilis TaxID=467358 RepID=A0A9N9MSX6_9CUCU|nr:unnamed protein product [Ceutorhynchus assimilis]CAG9770069.1 unnamed protein product [Ceutorhynchus assimilis]CAG9771654.1 unnamed protein product [Ceutorhynchus assimilis]
MALTEKGKRAGKTTRAQYQIYLDELQTNNFFRESKFDASDPDILKRTWEELSVKLNASGGPIREVAGWKRVFTDWRSQVRGKARKIKCAMVETGNAGDPPKSLTDLEERLLEITGKVVVDGMSGVPEIGLEVIVPSDEEREVPDEDGKQSVAKDKENIPSCSSQNTQKHEPPTKKRRTLTGTLRDMMSQPLEDKNILKQISTDLRKLRKIEAAKLKLRAMELEIQYPDYTFVVESSDSE